MSLHEPITQLREVIMGSLRTVTATTVLSTHVEDLQRRIHRRFCKVQTFNSCTSRPVVSQCLVVQTPMDNLPKKETSTSMTHVACESKLRSFVRSSVHPCPGDWVAIERLAVHHAPAAQAFGAGIECRHCSWQLHPCWPQ